MPRKTVFSARKIPASFAKKELGFKYKKNLLELLNNNNIDLHNFRNLTNFKQFAKTFKKNTDEVNQMENINQKQNKLIETYKDQAKQFGIFLNEADKLKHLKQEKAIKVAKQKQKEAVFDYKKLKEDIEKMEKAYTVMKNKQRELKDEGFKYGLNKKRTVNILVYQNVGKKNEIDEEQLELLRKSKCVVDSHGYVFKLRYAGKNFNIYNPQISHFANVISHGLNGKVYKGHTYRYSNHISGEETPSWEKLVSILDEDPVFLSYREGLGSHWETYCDMIVVRDVSPQFGKEIGESNADDFKPDMSQLFADDIEGGMYHKYINYTKNNKATTFNDLFNVPKTDYVQENYKANSCFLNILVNTYRKSFEKCKHYKFNGTYEDFCDLLDIDMKNDNIGITINKSLDFFKKFSLGLTVLGVFGKISVFKPEKINKNINPRNLYLVVYNNHCYQLNEDLKSIEQKFAEWKTDSHIKKEIDGLDFGLKADYFIRDVKDVKYKVTYIESLDDILQDIRDSDDADDEEIRRYVYTDDLKVLLMDMITSKPSYIPDIQFKNRRIISLKFKIGKIVGVIETQALAIDDYYVMLPADSYEAYHTASDKLYSQLLVSEHVSNYHPRNIEIQNKYLIRPMVGYFNNNTVCNIKYNGLDTRKAYTSDFMDIEFYPVFSYFDVWREYDNHVVEDYSQYLVMVHSKKNDFCSVLLFPKTVCRVYGYKLNRISNVQYKVLQYLRPSKLVPSNSKKLIQELWDSEISKTKSIDSQCKKDIFNVISGLLEKKYNEKSFTKVFKNYDEACYYQTKLGEQSDIVCITDDKYDGKYDEMFDEKSDRAFILNKTVKKDLQSGFLPIKDLIYEIRSLKNYQTCVKLMENDIEPLGVKTDSILFDISHTETVEKLFDMKDTIGCFKIEHNKELPNTLLQRGSIEMPKIINYDPIVHPIKDEYNGKEINSVLKQHNILILATCAGAGKSYCASKYPCEKQLWVCPYNTICLDARKKYDVTAITLDKLFGWGQHDKEHSARKSFNVSDYDCIVFDEILLHDPYRLMHIKKFMDINPNIKFLATGDAKQNKPIGLDELNNVEENIGQKYLMQCVNLLFPNQIILHESKRLKNKQDKIKMDKLAKEIFDTKIPVMDLMEKYGFNIISKMEDVKTTKNVCFFNFRCDAVNIFVKNNLITKQYSSLYKISNVEYWIGMDLICRKSYKDKAIRLFTNYTYKIKALNMKYVTLYEPADDITIKLDTSVLGAHFKYSWASTNHSLQGATLDEEYTLFDVNTPRVSRNWLYTALTRTNDLSKITIFKHSVADVDRLSKSMMRQYLENKVKNYKLQDQKSGRPFTEKDFITSEWIRDAHKQCMQCCKCHTPFEFAIVHDGYVKSNITVDRISSKLPHVKNNCQLMCMDCNRGKNKF